LNIFARMIERLTGRRGEDRGMSVAHDGRTSPDELEALARMTARAIRPEIKYAPPGEKLNVITTGDFDLKGKLKDATRKRIEDLAKAAKR
jgi:hypothetical protein